MQIDLLPSPEPPQILVIELWPKTANCHVCQVETPLHYGIPIGDTGEAVRNDYEGDWAGTTVCRSCFNLHTEWSNSRENISFEAFIRREQRRLDRELTLANLIYSNANY